MPANPRSTATRDALIQAAGPLFAARGFSGVSAREIVRAAGVALSAIPYHFKTMESLYQATLALAAEVAPEARVLAERALAAAPDEGLKLAIAWAIADLSTHPLPWALPLLERESLEPSAHFDAVVEARFRPEWEWLLEVVGRAAGRTTDDPATGFGVMTLHTMTSFFTTRRSLAAQLAPELMQRLENNEDLVAELARLTLTAVQGFGARPAAKRRPRAPRQERGAS